MGFKIIYNLCGYLLTPYEKKIKISIFEFWLFFFFFVGSSREKWCRLIFLILFLKVAQVPTKDNYEAIFPKKNHLGGQKINFLHNTPYFLRKKVILEGLFEGNFFSCRVIWVIFIYIVQKIALDKMAPKIFSEKFI